ncbi:MAG: allantoate amidohydrolase [Thalassobaculaceae bacterium]
MTSSTLPNISEMIHRLAELSESTSGITRQFLSPEHREANTLVGSWMEMVGMRVLKDPIGNIIGRYEGLEADLPAVMIGSHLDTVVNAGKFDGILGVVLAIHCISALYKEKKRYRFPIEVIGFADEEGTRFQSTYLGSKAVAGTFDFTTLSRTDTNGISMQDALLSFGLNPDQIQNAARKAKDISAYIELHIEQGPVLEEEDIPAGIVTEIAGAVRFQVTVMGTAGHAGTVPINLRKDALASACECVLSVEEIALKYPKTVGTVGQISVTPGASNVIPGKTVFTIDLRAANNEVRHEVEHELILKMQSLCRKRKTQISIKKVHEAPSVTCSPHVIEKLQNAFKTCKYKPYCLPSGAGHDAAAMADLTDVGMIFIRCKNGISHNPAEYVSEPDMQAGLDILSQFLNVYD